MKTHRLLLAICLVSLLPFCAFSEAPVVDDSENFALLDEQQVAELPVQRSYRDSSNDEEIPLATDNPDLDRSGGNATNNAVLLDKVQGLQQEVQELRGQLEVQAHDLKLLQQQQLAFYKDLDARLRGENPAAKKDPNLPVDSNPITTQPTPLDLDKSEPSKPSAKPAPTPIKKTSSSNNPADEQISYLAAYELVKSKKFDEALNAMQAFVAQHPQGGYSANAQYWLGELHMVKKNYPEAIEHFEVVLNQFPSSSKSAASMLKIGYALAASGKKEDAIQRLQQVIKNYPDTNTALLARNKLEALNS